MRKLSHRWLSQRGNDFIADWVNSEMIFSLSQRGNVLENNFAGSAPSFNCIQPAILSTDRGIYELPTTTYVHQVIRSP